MAGKLLIAGICLVVLISPALCVGGSSEITDSTYWSNLVHEENSLAASLLYIPYLVGQIPVRIIDAIINPKPTSMSTTPPPAHRIAP